MTSQPLYEKFVTDRLVSYIESQRLKFEHFKHGRTNLPDDLVIRITYCNNLAARYLKLKAVTIDDCRIDVIEDIRGYFNDDFGNHNAKLNNLRQWRDNEFSTIEESKVKRIRDKSLEIETYKKSLEDTLSPIVEKHKSLMSKRSELENIFKLYKLSTTKIEIDYSNSTLESLDELLDISLVACDSTIGNSNIFSKLVSLVYLPAVKKLEDETNNKVFKISWFVSLAILGFLARPYFFGVVGLLYIISMFGNLYKVYEKEEILYMAYSLSESLSFDRFVDSDSTYQKMLEDLDSISMFDTTGEKLKVDEEYEKRRAEIESSSPRKDLEKEERLYIENMESVVKQCEEAESEVLVELKKLLTSFEIELQGMRESFKKLKENSEFLGSTISESKVLDTKFRIGVGTFEGEIVAEATVEFPLEDIVFTYKSETERKKHVEFIKLMLCNSLCNIKENHLNVIIYDSHGLGKEFGEFYRSELKEIITAKNKDFKTLLEGSISSSTKNIQSMGVSDIQEFNRESEEVGKVTKDYKIIIILSCEDDLVRNPLFKEYMTYSASVGTWIWMLSKDESLFKDRDREDYVNFYKGLPRSYKPGIIEYSDTVVGDLRDPVTPYSYTLQLSGKVLMTLENMINENRIDILEYESGFRQSVIPDDKIWTYSTLNGIDLNFGYLDGDPSKPYTVTLGDAPPHGLGGGTTGAGKSGFIDFLLCNLVYKYTPEELDMILIDLKNVEFKKYTGDTLIPHASIIAGTKDGEYMVSVFDYIIQRMEDRVKEFGKYGLRNIVEYNNHVVNILHRKDLYMPRLFVLIDEYQVMFRDVDDISLDKIKQSISKAASLARFAGLHMLFISQSQDGTMSDSVKEQFGLRVCLRVNGEDTSKSLIGSGAAAHMPQPKGYMYSNTNGGGDQSSTKLWRVPYADIEYLKKTMSLMGKKCKEEGHINRQAEFYDEDDMYGEDTLRKHLVDVPEKLRREGRNTRELFILGERTSYSTNKLPVNFRLLKRDGEHIMVSAFEREPLINLFNTFKENVFSKEDSLVIIHSGDIDSSKVAGLEDLDEDNRKVITSNSLPAGSLLEGLEEMVKLREVGKENGDDDFPPTYVMLLSWDKLDGVGRGDTWKTMETMKPLLQKAGQVDIHFLMFVKSCRELSQIRGLFSHKIMAFHDDTESSLMIDSSKASKLRKDGKVALYQYGADMKKFKVYQFSTKGSLEEREMVLL